MSASYLEAHERRKAALLAAFDHSAPRLRVAKRTTSNLFRYQPRDTRGARPLSLGEFTHPLLLDTAAPSLDVEGLCTYEAVVRSTLKRGFLPTVTPELKHITVGGATVGIGIESSCFRHGFVHDGLIEAEVLLSDGRIVTARADNEHRDLFHALPNSYGTLGYVLRARLRLMPALPVVRIDNQRFEDIDSWLAAMAAACEDPHVDFVEGLFYSARELYLVTARMVESAPALDTIYGPHVYYRELREAPRMYLPTDEYIFRYDPEWFWNVPDTAPYRLFRRFAPRSVRNSGFYKRYTDGKWRWLRRIGVSPPADEEKLIQDWEVPWANAADLTRFALGAVDLRGLPWVAAPIRTPGAATLYPVRAGELYFNLGCYCYVRRAPGAPPFQPTRMIDQRCFELGGLKMLYSTTFLDRAAFDRIYNGAEYARLKALYDPGGRLPTLYDKAVGTS